jgi:hypothetical protein
MRTQYLVCLPGTLAGRLKRMVPAGERNSFLHSLVDAALPAAEDVTDPLRAAALSVTQDAVLAADMAEWGDAAVAAPAKAQAA